jgi:hypothetical protein
MLQPGDCVILNAPNSTVGRTLLQLCRLLKLRAIALLRPPPKAGGAAGERQWEAVSKQLSELGATLVLRDEGTIKVGGAWYIFAEDLQNPETWLLTLQPESKHGCLLSALPFTTCITGAVLLTVLLTVLCVLCGLSCCMLCAVPHSPRWMPCASLPAPSWGWMLWGVTVQPGWGKRWRGVGGW